MKKACFIFSVALTTSACLLAQGNSLLWRIEGPALPGCSYLYGTMHTTDRRVFHFADSVLPALERTSAFAMEVVVDEQAQQQILQQVFMPEGITLRTLLTGEQYDSVKRFALRTAGIDITWVENMKPLYANTILEMNSAADANTASIFQFLDGYLQQQAIHLGKKIGGLETVAEQMQVFDAVSYQDQAMLLMKSVREYEPDTAAYEKMLRLYVENDLQSMMTFLNDFHLPDSIYRNLVSGRNEVMSRRIDSMIREQTFFIAVGAGHLGGNAGLVSMLRDKGYSVIPVIPTYRNHLPGGWYRYSDEVSFEVAFPGLPVLLRPANGDLMEYKAVAEDPGVSYEVRRIRPPADRYCHSHGTLEAALHYIVGSDFYLEEVSGNQFKGKFSSGIRAEGLAFLDDRYCHAVYWKGNRKPDKKTIQRFLNSFKKKGSSP